MARPKMSPFDREAQYRAKRRAVIFAAGQAFRRRGYHNTSMREIAKSLGLTKTALYYYVKSKEEILYACHMMVYDAMDGLILSTRKTTKGTNGLRQLLALYGEFVKLLTQDGLALLADVDSLSGEYQEQVMARRSIIERAVTRIVKAGIKDGSIAKADPKMTVFFFMGALNWLNVWYEDGGRLDGQEISKHFVRQLQNGIAAR